MYPMACFQGSIKPGSTKDSGAAALQSCERWRHVGADSSESEMQVVWVINMCFLESKEQLEYSIMLLTRSIFFLLLNVIY